MAAEAFIKATCEPTERSMPAVIITNVIAIATIRMGAAWRRMFSKFPKLKKTSVATEKNTMQMMKKKEMDKSCACYVKKSAIAEPSPRSV